METRNEGGAMSKINMTSALFIMSTTTSPATPNWYSWTTKRAHAPFAAHFAAYAGAGAYGVNG